MSPVFYVATTPAIAVHTNWYQRLSLCYAILVDADVGCCAEDAELPRLYASGRRCAFREGHFASVILRYARLV